MHSTGRIDVAAAFGGCGWGVAKRVLAAAPSVARLRCVDRHAGADRSGETRARFGGVCPDPNAHRSADWLIEFRRHVLAIPDAIDFHRVSGDYDYRFKVVSEDMAGYDRVYRRWMDGAELDSVASFFAMETIAEGRSMHLRSVPWRVIVGA